MLRMMFLGVVRVNGMGHICGEEETSVDSLEVLILVEGGKASKDALSDLYAHVAVSTLSGL